jgi:hypothetical protein
MEGRGSQVADRERKLSREAGGIMGKAVGSIVLDLVQSIAAILIDRKGPSKACGGA